MFVWFNTILFNLKSESIITDMLSESIITDMLPQYKLNT